MAGSEDFSSTAALNTASSFSNTSVNRLGVVSGNGNRVGNCGQGSVSAVLVLFSGTFSPLFPSCESTRTRWTTPWLPMRLRSKLRSIFSIFEGYWKVSSGLRTVRIELCHRRTSCRTCKIKKWPVKWVINTWDQLRNSNTKWRVSLRLKKPSIIYTTCTKNVY